MSDLTVQSLPIVLPESFDKFLEIRSAYSTTLLLEHAASSNTDPKIRERKLIHARVLGHLLREAPSMHASENVANQVNSCQNDNQLDALGEMYLLHYICAFRIRENGEDTDWEFSPPSTPERLSFKTKRELMEHMLRTNGGSCRRGEETRTLALVRDGFRCIVSGGYDYLLVGQSTELMQEVMDSDSPAVSTKCVHIFPESIAMISSVNDKDAKINYAASIFNLMTYFGFDDLPENPEKLVRSGIHPLENVMTLNSSFACLFEELCVWFEAIGDQDNTYAVRASQQAMLRSYGDNPITLTSQHPDLPLPNRTFLAIHAACCRVAHLSGAAGYIEKALDGMEEIGVMAKEGPVVCLRVHSQEMAT